MGKSTTTYNKIQILKHSVFRIQILLVKQWDNALPSVCLSICVSLCFSGVSFFLSITIERRQIITMLKEGKIESKWWTCTFLLSLKLMKLSAQWLVKCKYVGTPAGNEWTTCYFNASLGTHYLLNCSSPCYCKRQSLGVKNAFKMVLR